MTHKRDEIPIKTRKDNQLERVRWLTKMELEEGEEVKFTVMVCLMAAQIGCLNRG